VCGDLAAGSGRAEDDEAWADLAGDLAGQRKKWCRWIMRDWTSVVSETVRLLLLPLD
jgi:hypothetical protein